MLLETRMDRENSCEGMQLLAPKTKQINLIFSGSPVPAPASAKVVLDNYPGKSAAVRLSCSLPDYRHFPLPPSLASSLTGGSVASAENGRGSGRLPAGAGSLPLLQSVSMVYVLLLRCFFPVLTLYSPRSIVWGLFFFLLTFLMLCCNFLQFPVFLSCPPPCHICMLYGQVDGLFHWYLWLSDNKGLLLLLLIFQDELLLEYITRVYLIIHTWV